MTHKGSPPPPYVIATKSLTSLLLAPSLLPFAFAVHPADLF